MIEVLGGTKRMTCCWTLANQKIGDVRDHFGISDFVREPVDGSRHALV